uniref:Uncharacterized protein n=1 Tax=Noctiluca scintillans TaxID=2966 RepID=A0A7S1B1H5_NOCSC|eukprot:CAMPEP_0194478492 /NCGR_PEP_ID=MMETSP0253-20130528/1914_1 /TAXON_ID=2966 /ORGANISM="Noctiluca scintillans" /LENGTH=226 /DNA_ID=CAMNT_0039317587 /DNA_START=33 /DNA_END=713 /DNA_ORIENTATION=+
MADETPEVCGASRPRRRRSGIDLDLFETPKKVRASVGGFSASGRRSLPSKDFDELWSDKEEGTNEVVKTPQHAPVARHLQLRTEGDGADTSLVSCPPPDNVLLPLLENSELRVRSRGVGDVWRDQRRRARAVSGSPAPRFGVVEVLRAQHTPRSCPRGSQSVESRCGRSVSKSVSATGPDVRTPRSSLMDAWRVAKSSGTPSTVQPRRITWPGTSVSDELNGGVVD